MAWLAVAAIAAGTLINTYAKMKAAKEQSAALEEDADYIRMQAEETLERAKINEDAIYRAANQQIGGLSVSESGSGVSGGSVGLTQIESIMNEAAVATVNARRETHFQRQAMLRQARGMDKQAVALRKSSKLSALGGLLGGAGAAMSAAPASSDSKSDSNNSGSGVEYTQIRTSTKKAGVK